MQRDALIRELDSILGPDGLITAREELMTYESDALSGYRVMPGLVVLLPPVGLAFGFLRLQRRYQDPYVLPSTRPTNDR